MEAIDVERLKKAWEMSSFPELIKACAEDASAFVAMKRDQHTIIK